MTVQTATKLQAEQAMQLALEDILSYHKAPEQELLSQMPQGEMMVIIQKLIEALPSGEPATKRVFKALIPDHKWLTELRSKPLPPRPGEGTDKQQQDETNDRPYLLHPLSFFKNIPKREWGVDKLIYDRGTSAWVGDGGSGKSAIVLDMMLSRAYGLQFAGRNVKQGFIVWVAAESVDEIYPRVYGWQLYHKVATDQEPNIWFLDERVPFNNMAEVDLFIESIKAQAEEMKIDIDGFVFDTYARCTPGADENNTQETKIIVESIDRISKAFNTHVAVIHHTNSQGKIRGSTVLKNDVDTAWTVTKESGTIRMHCEKMRGTIEPPDFPLKMISQIIDDNNIEDTAPVVVTAEGCSEQVTPHAQSQMLEILHAHGQVSCNAWAKHCKEAYNIAERTFYTYKKSLLQEGLIEAPNEKVKGKATFYTLTQKGLDSLG